jgi:hypothetical protein
MKGSKNWMMAHNPFKNNYEFFQGDNNDQPFLRGSKNWTMAHNPIL